jgi:hypothetical protein
MNIKSKFLNRTQMAKVLNMSPQQFDNKLNGRGRAKPLNDAEKLAIEISVKDDLQIPLENINPDTI